MTRLPYANEESRRSFGVNSVSGEKRNCAGRREMEKRTAAIVKRFVLFINTFINVLSKNTYSCVIM